MNLNKKYKTIKKLIDISYKVFVLNKILKVRIPLIVSWAITHRCNSNCFYCGFNNLTAKDLDTEKALSLIDEMSKMGTKFISLTGGEPLLRNDIAVIVKHCKSKGFYVNINTNGSLLPGKVKEIEEIDSICFSLDGPLDINDKIRGEGSYKIVIDALKIAKKKPWRLKFTTVLSKNNLDSIDYILDLGRHFEVVTSFQPARVLKPGSLEDNPLIPPQESYYRAIRKLISYKLANNPYIENSLSCLQHLFCWPNQTFVPCVAGQIFCRVEYDGIIKGCSEVNTEGIDCKEIGFKNAFERLKLQSCLQCWCSNQLELNFIFSLKFNSIFNFFKKII